MPKYVKMPKKDVKVLEYKFMVHNQYTGRTSLHETKEKARKEKRGQLDRYPDANVRIGEIIKDGID